MNPTDAPPPPQSNSLVTSPTRYISTRPSLGGPPPSDIITHSLPLSPPFVPPDNARPLPFPSPESLWTTRGVTHEDWKVFTTQISKTRPLEGNVAVRERRYRILSEWNDTFFQLRGLQVVTEGESQEGNVVVEDGNTKFDASLTPGGVGTVGTETDERPKSPKGLGFRVGRLFFGLYAGGEQASGFGLALPGPLSHSLMFGVTKLKGKEKKDGE